MLEQRHPDDDAAVLVLAGDVPLACRAVPGLLAALAGDPRNDGAHLVATDGRLQSVVAIYGVRRFAQPSSGSLTASTAAPWASSSQASRSRPVVSTGGHGMDADT